MFWVWSSEWCLELVVGCWLFGLQVECLVFVVCSLDWRHWVLVWSSGLCLDERFGVWCSVVGSECGVLVLCFGLEFGFGFEFWVLGLE